MAKEAQLCPFCAQEFTNIKALKKHLLKYTARWRIPADRVHDVLEIKNLVIMKDHFGDDEDTGGRRGDRKASYKCPSCAKLIRQRRNFIEHVFYQQHYVAIDGLKGIPESPGFSIDPEPHRIWPPTDKFDFLALPSGKPACIQSSFRMRDWGIWLTGHGKLRGTTHGLYNLTLL